VLTGEEIAALHTGWEAVLSVRFSPDGKYLVAGGGLAAGSREVAVYALAARRARRRLVGHRFASLNGLAVHPSGEVFATATNDTEVAIWNHDTMAWSQLPEPPYRRAAIVDLAFGGEHGTLLAVMPRDVIAPSKENAAADYAIALWNWRDKKFDRLLEGHRKNVESRAFDATARRLATGDASGTAIVWDVAAGNEIARLTSGDGALRLLKFVDGDENLLSLHVDGKASVRKIAGAEAVRSAQLSVAVASACVAHGDTLYVGTPAGELAAYSAAGDSFGRETMAAVKVSPDGRSVAAIAESPDGRYLAVAAHRHVALWDVERRELRYTLPPQDVPVFNLAFDAAGEKLIVCGRQDVVTVWNLESLEEQFATFGLD
jgi:WD40 repeat protein